MVNERNKRFGSCLVAANLLLLPAGVAAPAELGVGVDVAKRMCESGHSLSRSAPGEVSRGGVVLMAMFAFKVYRTVCYQNDLSRAALNIN